MSRKAKEIKESDKILTEIIQVIGYKNIIFNFGFIFSLLITFVYWMYYSNYNIDKNLLYEYMGDTLLSTSGALLGIVIAGLAIIMAVLQERILHALYKLNLLKKFLYPFGFISILWGSSTLICFFIDLFSLTKSEFLIPLVFFEIFLFTYALCSTVGLILDTLKIALVLAKLEN